MCFGYYTLNLDVCFTFYDAFSFCLNLAAINPVWIVCTHTFILGLPLIPHSDYLQTHLAHAVSSARWPLNTGSCESRILQLFKSRQASELQPRLLWKRHAVRCYIKIGAVYLCRPGGGWIWECADLGIMWLDLMEQNDLM